MISMDCFFSWTLSSSSGMNVVTSRTIIESTFLLLNMKENNVDILTNHHYYYNTSYFFQKLVIKTKNRLKYCKKNSLNFKGSYINSMSKEKQLRHLNDVRGTINLYS